MRHLIDPLDLSPEEITSLLDLADRIRSDPAAYQDVAAHKKLATLFYEPSTRTRLSFEAAMLNLGATRKKVRPCAPAAIPASRSSTRATAATSTPPRP